MGLPPGSASESSADEQSNGCSVSAKRIDTERRLWRRTDAARQDEAAGQELLGSQNEAEEDHRGRSDKRPANRRPSTLDPPPHRVRRAEESSVEFGAMMVRAEEINIGRESKITQSGLTSAAS